METADNLHSPVESVELPVVEEHGLNNLQVLLLPQLLEQEQRQLPPGSSFSIAGMLLDFRLGILIHWDLGELRIVRAGNEDRLQRAHMSPVRLISKLQK